MKVIVNKEERTIPAQSTLEDLVHELKLDHQSFAVELNKEIVPKKELGQTILKENDEVYVVSFVGGG